MKKAIFALMLMFFALTSLAQEKKEIHILSSNDMHAAIECFPRLSFVADSLRALYPNLLILSAGDNRSGDPLNDMYEIPAYPMVALMNMVGFHSTTLGNHEFDSGEEGLAKLINMSNFSYLCANVFPANSTGINLRPWQKFDIGEVCVGVIGITALGQMGTPESHPNNMKDISFTTPLETIKQYEFLRKECDVIVLLSHLGFEDDVKISASLPWVDVIIGGHSHTQLKGGEIHNGLLITQNENRLKQVTHTTLTLHNGKITDKQAENIVIRGGTNENKVVKTLVEYFCNNPAFERVLAIADASFSSYEELGCLIADALVNESEADLSFQNAGGVRYDTHEAGPITMKDILRLDPFQNDVMIVSLTGKELVEILAKCYNNDQKQFPYLGGMTAEYVVDTPTKQLKKITLFDKDGKKLNMKKTYRVVTNSYALAISPTKRKDEGHSLNVITTELIMNYLEHQRHINYQGKTCLKEIKE